jgi:hypothetical protein
MEIIIRDKDKKYKQFSHRSSVEEILKKEWGTQGLSDEQIDKAKHIERKLDIEQSSVKAHIIDETK